MAGDARVPIRDGGSDNHHALPPLVELLHARGWNAKALWRGDYISMPGEGRIRDVATHLRG